MKGNIKAIIKKPGEKAEVVIIVNSLENLQAIVEGYIETVPFPNMENVDIILDEEGKLKGSKPNIYLHEYEDILCGTMIVVGVNLDEGEFISLDEEQIKKVEKYLNNNDAKDFEGDIEDSIHFEVFFNDEPVSK